MPVGSSLSAHSQGQHDELCTSVAGKELSEEPCSLLDSNDSWLYLIFPQSKLCCRYVHCCCVCSMRNVCVFVCVCVCLMHCMRRRACNVTDHCGIILPTWLEVNSTYQGGAATAASCVCVGGARFPPLSTRADLIGARVFVRVCLL
jgi:hypothetical protein